MARLRLTDFENAANLREIPLSTPTRAIHRGCSTDAAATVTRTPVGWMMHCFRCDERGFEYARVASLPNKRALTMTAEAGMAGAQLPNDTLWTEADWTTECNEEWASRFAAYGIDPMDLRRRTFGWSAGTSRLFFPLSKVTHNKATDKYSLSGGKNTDDACAAGKRHPNVSAAKDAKWIVYQPHGCKEPLVFGHGFKSHVWDGKTIVLCEDPISALKIGGRTGFAALALLGLSIPQELLVFLSTRKQDVVVWTDGDAPGMRRGRKIYDQIKFLKPNTYFTYVEGKDPKHLNHEQIKEHIASLRKETGTVA